MIRHQHLLSQSSLPKIANYCRPIHGVVWKWKVIMDSNRFQDGQLVTPSVRLTVTYDHTVALASFKVPLNYCKMVSHLSMASFNVRIIRLLLLLLTISAPRKICLCTQIRKFDDVIEKWQCDSLTPLMVDGTFNKRLVAALPILTDKELIAQGPTSCNYTM